MTNILKKASTLVLIVIFAIVMGSTSFAFADSDNGDITYDTEIDSDTIITYYEDTIPDYNDMAADSATIVLKGTTSKHELVNSERGTKYNDKKTKKIVYTIDTYKVSQKAEHSSTWHYDYTEYHWTFKGYTKKNGKWGKPSIQSGIDRVHNDPMSLLNYYIHS